MRNNNIYCSKLFWETFSKDRKRLYSSFKEEDLILYRCWINYFLMLSHSSLNFEFDEKFILESRDETLCQLWHAVASGIKPRSSFNLSCDLNLLESNITTSPTKDLLNSTYLTDKELKKYSKHGILAVSNEDYLSKVSYFKDSGAALQKKSNCSWRELLSVAKHLFNALVIVDNWIFSDKTDINLLQILETLLPYEIDIPFHLTIITSNEKIWSDSELQKKRKAVVSCVEKIRPDLVYRILIEVFAISKSEIHDRTIITNYMWIGSGSGFDILQNNKQTRQTEATKSTKLSAVFPRFIDDEEWEKAYDNLIRDCRKALKRIGVTSQNRLLK